MPETNSSSSHSLAIYENDPTVKNNLVGLTFEDSGKTIIIPDYFDAFGWGPEIIYSAGFKACYTVSCICGLFSGKKLDKEREKFEKVIKDYTGAEKIKYGWLNNVKDTRHNFTTRAPTVDHQSISRMYDSISETEESMRDFIFSNRSQLIIDGEDTPSLDVLRKKSPGITNHETKIIFYVNISGEKNNGIETIYHTKWPGGKVIRNNIINFGANLQYNATKKIFEKRRYFYGTNPINEEIYGTSVPVFEKNEIRFYNGNRLTEDFGISTYDSIECTKALETDLPYASIKFEIIGGDV